ncbi:cysteine-rich repeat secretory protein 38-like [Telopea speciosissima]|uniref:cysteine-rich repeat secretory protein 38-like n=1 Tax=Telopea speciosissima TaxID=54955 RepID=UPI001CC40CDB|nr:cysteine-rich repeat secretory protein 38-like [Telopea speciosissima]
MDLVQLLLMLLISCILNLVVVCITAQRISYSYTGPSGFGHTTNSSTYLANLNLLLHSLSSSSNATGFYNTTIGDGSDKVFGLFLCRGHITHQDCQNCVEMASEEIKSLCHNISTAISWYDKCLIRYSNQSIFSILQQDPVFYVYGAEHVTNLDQYNQTVGNLMNLVTKAASGSSIPKYYAAGSVSYTGNDNVYGMVQCTPDITQDECNGCLSASVSNIPRKLYSKEGGRILKPSCNLTYEFNNPFYQDASSPPPANPPSTTSTGKHGISPPPANPPSTTSTDKHVKNSNSTVKVTVIIIVVMAGALTIMIIFILYPRIRRKKKLKVEAFG